METKTNRGHSIQAAKAACSNAISKARAHKTSQAVMKLHKEHGKFMQGLEEQAFREESRSCHEFLSSCQATLYHSPLPLRGALATSYHLLLGQAPPSPPPILPPRTPCRRTAIHSCSFHTNAQTVSKTEKVTSFTRAYGEHAYGWSHPDGHTGRTSKPQEVRDPSLVQVA